MAEKLITSNDDDAMIKSSNAVLGVPIAPSKTQSSTTAEAAMGLHGSREDQVTAAREMVSGSDRHIVDKPAELTVSLSRGVAAVMEGESPLLGYGGRIDLEPADPDLEADTVTTETPGGLSVNSILAEMDKRGLVDEASAVRNFFSEPNE